MQAITPNKNPIIAIQIDPLDSININTDSTLLICKELQSRGYQLFFYQPHNLLVSKGCVLAQGFFAELLPSIAPYYKITHKLLLDLKYAKLILVRQNPPFDMSYISATYILDMLKNEVLILNNPSSIREHTEKIFPFDFPKLIPPSTISSNLHYILDFINEHQIAVIKPLYGHAGHDIIKLNKQDPEIENKIILHLQKFQIILAQKFIPEVINGDKRIILIDGEVVGIFKRKPKEGDFRANLAAGAIALPTQLSQQDKIICDILGPKLQEYELFFVGIDIIDQYLIEINNTSPTGLISINNLYNIEIEKIIVNKIEKKLSSWYKSKL